MTKHKHIIAAILLCTVLYGAEWDDPSLPQAKVNKPIVQLKWGWFPPGDCWVGGAWQEVRIPSTEDIEKKLKLEFELQLQEQRLNEVKWANRCIKYGFLFAIVCAILHGCNSLEPLKNLFSYGIGGGIVSVIGGIGYKWYTVNEVAIGWILGVCIFFGLSIWLLSHKSVRDWSASHLFTKLREEK